MKMKLNVLYVKGLKYIYETFIVLTFSAMWTFELRLMIWSSIYRKLFWYIYEKPFKVFAHSFKSLYDAMLIKVLQFGIVYEVTVTVSKNSDIKKLGSFDFTLLVHETKRNFYFFILNPVCSHPIILAPTIIVNYCVNVFY